MKSISTFAASICSIALCSTFASAGLPDNGFGTVDMPLAGDYVADHSFPDNYMYIINGLPLGPTIQFDPILTTPANTAEISGGSLGGTASAGAGNGFQFHMQGTGGMSGYTRDLFLSLGGAGGVASFPEAPVGSGYEVHTAPRTPGNPVQSFDCDMFRMFGQIANPGAGDPDFDLLRIVAGTDFGLPSPGHTTLWDIGGGQWAVDSFFDITYRIDFVGNPTGPFAGRSGSTTGTIRMVLPEPATLSVLAGAGMIVLRRRRV